jgi:hypothetical protein
MLTVDEYAIVVSEVADHLGPTGDVRTLISVTFTPNHKPILAALPTSLSNIGDQARWLVEYCLLSRWTLNPSLLESLLVRMVNIAGRGNLAPLRDRVRGHEDPNPDIFQTRWVLANQPFFDRKQIRVTAKLLLEQSAQPILRVNGPQGSGKTYTAELLAFVMERARPDLHVVLATLEELSGPSYEVYELAETLTLPMKIDEPMPARSSSSYPAALCRWILRNTLKQPGVWIFVLDGFGQRDVKAEVRELIQNLAKHLLTPEIGKRLRLVLLDYNEALLGNWRAKTLDDNLPDPISISPADLEECLDAYNKRMREEGRPHKVIEPSGIGELAASLIQRAPSNSSERLRGLYDQLLGLFELGQV